MKALDRSIDNISKRLNIIEGEEIREETDAEIEARFAKLREARVMNTNASESRTSEDVWDNITQEELDYYKRQNLKVPPEQRYQNKKEHWYFHESSWYMRGLDAYDRYGCNQFTGCIPECRYYAKVGRIEDEEVLSWYERKT